MKYIDKLKEPIELYIKESQIKIDTYEQERTNVTLCESLLTYLNDTPENIKENKMLISILLDSVYSGGEVTKKFYQIIVNFEDHKADLEELIENIKKTYEELKKSTYYAYYNVKRLKNIIQSAGRVYYCITHNIPINQTTYDILNIKFIFNHYRKEGKITPQEEILLINEIDSYNKLLALDTSNKQEKKYAAQRYEEIPNIVLMGFQEHDKIELPEEEKTFLDKIITEIKQYINHVEDNKVIELLEMYKTYDLTDKQYRYLITNILDYYLEKLLELYNILLDRDIYIKRNNRLDIVKEYYQLLEIYLSLVSYYNTSFQPEEEIVEETKEEQKILIYSHTDNFKGKILSDMKDLPNEYYEKVITLLSNFKQGNISNKQVKYLKSNKEFIGYSELKDDQVRIIYRHIKDNIYCIIGVFVKKSDNDIGVYNKLIRTRIIPDISTKEKFEQEITISKATEEALNEYAEKSRKGTR